jgi:hypothetical protein
MIPHGSLGKNRIHCRAGCKFFLTSMEISNNFSHRVGVFSQIFGIAAENTDPRSGLFSIRTLKKACPDVQREVLLPTRKRA